jgi:GMP synthase (glutamine-hydrolysing)
MAAKPVVRVLQHIAPEGPGLIADALAARGIDVAVTRGDLGEPIPDTTGDAVGLLVMGGPMGVYEADRYPFLSEEQRLIERALTAEVPVLGVCLGSQLLAATLGARVAPGPRKEIGWLDVFTTEGASSDPLLGSAPARFRALHWHGDAFELPDGAVSLARSELTAFQAFRWGRCAHGLLFHLEAGPDQVEAMAHLFADELAESEIDPAALIADTSSAARASAPIAAAVFGAWAATLRV